MRYILFILLISSTLFAYVDSDMDGVEDNHDRCPDTPLTDLVDNSGCTVKSLVSPHHYDIILGFSLSQLNANTLESTSTYNSSLQLDYYYKEFSLQSNISYFNSGASSYSNQGLNDTFIGSFYNFRVDKKLLFRVGLGVLLPTYISGLNNNNTDINAMLSFNYRLNNINFFGSYTFTKVNDDDYYYTDSDQNPAVIAYKDTSSGSGGIGFYPTQKLYTSLSYNYAQSIYKNVVDIQSSSIYLLYTFNQHLFITANYSYGLSESASDHYIATRVGYYF